VNREQLLQKLRDNMLRKHPDECFRARSATQLGPDGISEAIWDSLSHLEQAEERLLKARVRGPYHPGDLNADGDWLCSCGRWQMPELSPGINPCYDCERENGAPWQSGYWWVVGQLNRYLPKSTWADRWNTVMGYAA